MCPCCNQPHAGTVLRHHSHHAQCLQAALPLLARCKPQKALPAAEQQQEGFLPSSPFKPAIPGTLLCPTTHCLLPSSS